MAKITKDTTIGEAIQIDAGIVPILMSAGMHCVGCPSSAAGLLAEPPGAVLADVLSVAGTLTIVVFSALSCPSAANAVGNMVVMQSSIAIKAAIKRRSVL